MSYVYAGDDPLDATDPSGLDGNCINLGFFNVCFGGGSDNGPSVQYQDPQQRVMHHVEQGIVKGAYDLTIGGYVWSFQTLTDPNASMGSQILAGITLGLPFVLGPEVGGIGDAAAADVGDVTAATFGDSEAVDAVTAPALRAARDMPRGGNGIVLQDAEGATPAEVAASRVNGGTRIGQHAARVRELGFEDAREIGPTLYRCWRCGQTTVDPQNVVLGHRNIATANGGNLDPVNTCLEGGACNLSAGNRGFVNPGMDCVSRGGCGAPYGRFG